MYSINETIKNSNQFLLVLELLCTDLYEIKKDRL